MTAILPAQILYIGAQFASNDECRGIITAINIKQANDVITITSTDGIRAFRCSFEISESYHMDEEELNIHYGAFKKRIAKSQTVRIGTKEASFTGDKCETVIREIYPVSGVYPEVTGKIWPDVYTNEPEAPIGFNSKLLTEYLTEVSRFSSSGKVRMETNSPTQPMQFSATIEPFGESFETQYLLMPLKLVY